MIILIFFAGCRQGKTPQFLLRSIDEKEKELYKKEKVLSPADEPVKAQIGELVALYEDFAYSFPEDERCPGLLYKAVQLYKDFLNNKTKAIECSQRIFDQYPSSKEAPVSLFHIGYIYANDLMLYDKAKAAYEKFLQLYPEHDFAEAARFELKFMGKPVEELPIFKEGNEEEGNKP